VGGGVGSAFRHCVLTQYQKIAPHTHGGGGFPEKESRGNMGKECLYIYIVDGVRRKWLALGQLFCVLEVSIESCCR